MACTTPLHAPQQASLGLGSCYGQCNLRQTTACSVGQPAAHLPISCACPRLQSCLLGLPLSLELVQAQLSGGRVSSLRSGRHILLDLAAASSRSSSSSRQQQEGDEMV
jgi:hypothetical protein